MEILSLLPILLKILPFAAIGVLYALWRMAAYSRDKAREERDNAEDSYELAGEVTEIEKEKNENVQAIENLDLGGVIDALRGVVRDPKPKD
jgi:hypothetical protein